MKLKNWMETHIVLRYKWKKKDKRKKNKDEEKPVNSTLASWRTSNFLHFFASGNTESRFNLNRKEVPSAINGPKFAFTTPPVSTEDYSLPATDTSRQNSKEPQQKIDTVKDDYTFGDHLFFGDGKTIPHVCKMHIDHVEQVENANLNSPRQRSKIRTNPWLTPKQARVFPSNVSYSSSDCGSSSWENASDSTHRMSDNSRHSILSNTTESDETGSAKSALPPVHASRQVMAIPYLAINARFQPPGHGIKLEDSRPGHSEEDSDLEECETIDEMGNFDEHYEYDGETDILGEADGSRCGRNSVKGRRSSRRHHTIVVAPAKSRNLHTDEDYSERLEFADEAYSEASGSLDDEAGGGGGISFSDGEEKDERETQVDSAFPSESSSLATTPLLEGTASSSGSDSGIQHSGWSDANRALSSIRVSLEDKVRHLRLERMVVEEKIREAKEEDRQRRLEREKFRKELIFHRRQVLLRTLNELRHKLEVQSVQLQEAYHSTLEMQLHRRCQLATVVEENAASNRIPHGKLL